MKLNLNININANSALFIETSSLAELDEVREYLTKQKIPSGLADVKGESGKEAAVVTGTATAATKPAAAAGAKGKGGKADAPAATAVKTVAGPTIEEVTAALTAVADKFGVPEALILNKRFGAKRAGELAADQYADYIAFASHCVDDNVAPSAAHAPASENDDVSSLV